MEILDVFLFSRSNRNDRKNPMPFAVDLSYKQSYLLYFLAIMKITKLIFEAPTFRRGIQTEVITRKIIDSAMSNIIIFRVCHGFGARAFRCIDRSASKKTQFIIHCDVNNQFPLFFLTCISAFLAKISISAQVLGRNLRFNGI